MNLKDMTGREPRFLVRIPMRRIRELCKEMVTQNVCWRTVWTVLDLTVEALSRGQTPQGGLELRAQVPHVTFPLERLVRRIAYMQWRQSGQRG